MVLDTSAVIAAIANEEDSSRYQAAMLSAEALFMSSIAALETRIVLFARLGPDAVAHFDRMLEQAGIVVIPFDEDLARTAFEAFRRYGRGRGHPARLNIVHCAVYALAKTRSEPLLFKGDDFAHTDLRSALPRS
jgi:ribonuclease VapC